jgi:hypothetical protein
MMMKGFPPNMTDEHRAVIWQNSGTREWSWGGRVRGRQKYLLTLNVEKIQIESIESLGESNEWKTPRICTETVAAGMVLLHTKFRNDVSLEARVTRPHLCEMSVGLLQLTWLCTWPCVASLPWLWPCSHAVTKLVAVIDHGGARVQYFAHWLLIIIHTFAGTEISSFSVILVCNYVNSVVSSDYTVPGGTRWRSRLRHCATSRKVAGSIPDGVTGIFQWLSPSGRTMALGSTQPLT